MTHNRGFTVLEMLVALVLTSVVVLAAAQLVAESAQVIDGAGRTMRSPSFTLAMATLRRDVQGAAGAGPSSAHGWSEGALELISWDGHRVRIFVEGDAIVRQTVDESGRSTGRRVLVRGVSAWWWRSPDPWTIDLRMTATVIPDPIPARQPVALRRTETRRFAMRGSPGGRSW